MIYNIWFVLNCPERINKNLRLCTDLHKNIFDTELYNVFPACVWVSEEWDFTFSIFSFMNMSGNHTESLEFYPLENFPPVVVEVSDRLTDADVSRARRRNSDLKTDSLIFFSLYSCCNIAASNTQQCFINCSKSLWGLNTLNTSTDDSQTYTHERITHMMLRWRRLFFTVRRKQDVLF